VPGGHYFCGRSLGLGLVSDSFALAHPGSPSIYRVAYHANLEHENNLSGRSHQPLAKENTESQEQILGRSVPTKTEHHNNDAAIIKISKQPQ